MIAAPPPLVTDDVPCIRTRATRHPMPRTFRVSNRQVTAVKKQFQRDLYHALFRRYRQKHKKCPNLARWSVILKRWVASVRKATRSRSDRYWQEQAFYCSSKNTPQKPKK